MQRRRSSLLAPSPLLLAGLLAVGCEEQPKPAPAPSASAAEAPPVDAKLDSALKAVEQQGEAAAAPSTANQPPASGIFGPGEADRAHATNAPPKVELLDAGAEPRLSLGASARPDKEKTKLLVSLSTGGQQALPPLEIALETSRVGADDAGAAKGAKADAEPAAPAPSGESRFVTKVADVAIAGGAAVPKQVAEALAKMKGSTLTFTLSPTGPVAFERKLGKDAEPSLEIALRAIEDALTAVYVPTPTQPVGEGGYWMVTDRRTALGVDVVRYRVFRVAKVDGDVALLGLDIRQYAADDRVDLPLGPQLAGASLDTYGCAAKGAVDLAPKTLFPSAAQIALRVQAGVVPPGGKAQPAQQRPRAQMAIELVGQLGGEPKSAALVMAAQPGEGE